MFFFVLIFVEKIGIRDGLRNQTITNFGSKQKKVVKSRRSKIKRLKIWNSLKWSDKSFSCQLNNFTKKLWNSFCGKNSWKHNGFRLFNCWQLRFDKKKFENYENYFVGKNRENSQKCRLIWQVSPILAATKTISLQVLTLQKNCQSEFESKMNLPNRRKRQIFEPWVFQPLLDSKPRPSKKEKNKVFIVIYALSNWIGKKLL